MVRKKQLVNFCTHHSRHESRNAGGKKFEQVHSTLTHKRLGIGHPTKSLKSVSDGLVRGTAAKFNCSRFSLGRGRALDGKYRLPVLRAKVATHIGVPLYLG